VTAPYGYQVYVMGATAPQFSYGGTLVFNDVADLGDFSQAVVAIDGNYRWISTPVQVQQGQNATVALSLYGWGTDEVGAFKPAWHSDGTRLGYAFGCASLYGISDHPTAGTMGQVLFNREGISPCVMAWGSTSAKASQFVYSTSTNTQDAQGRGIYLTAENSSTPPTRLITTDAYVFGIQYLPDASGFIISMTDQDMYHLGDSSSLWRYDFASGALTQLTHLKLEYVRDFSISPDGQSIVFERAPKQSFYFFGGPSDLWIMGIDGSNPHLLVAGGAHPSWSRGALQMPGSGTSSGTSLQNKLYIPLVKK
jgi:hypothetical protein